MSAELDKMIQEKRSQLKDAFAAYKRAREAVAQAPETELQRMQAEERGAAKRFHAISAELGKLHRDKFGEWHVTFRGPGSLTAFFASSPLRGSGIDLDRPRDFGRSRGDELLLRRRQKKVE